VEARLRSQEKHDLQADRVQAVGGEGHEKSGARAWYDDKCGNSQQIILYPVSCLVDNIQRPGVHKSLSGQNAQPHGRYANRVAGVV
jgi:hypothetical protein